MADGGDSSGPKASSGSGMQVWGPSITAGTREHQCPNTTEPHHPNITPSVTPMFSSPKRPPFSIFHTFFAYTLPTSSSP